MKKKLSGLDRINIPVMLDRASIEGSETEMITLRAVKKDLLTKLQLTEQDLEQFRIQPRPGGGVSWDSIEINKEKTFDLGTPEITFLKQVRDSLDREKRITEQILDTCLKIKEWEIPEDKEK